MGKQCGDCKFWNPPEAIGNAGECRKNPPTMQPMPMQSAAGQMGMTIHGIFPPAKRDAWCGQWEPALPLK